MDALYPIAPIDPPAPVGIDPSARPTSKRKPIGTAQTPPRVTSHLRPDEPVSETEIRMVLGFLGDTIADLFGGE